MSTVLLVEDEKEVRELLGKYIEKNGYTVLTAGNGEEGLRLALDREPNLVVADIRMPSMSGYQMVKKLRESGSWGAKVPVIYLTNISPSNDAEHADIENTEPVHYIVKGDVDPDDVIAKIKQVLPA